MSFQTVYCNTIITLIVVVAASSTKELSKEYRQCSRRKAPEGKPPDVYGAVFPVRSVTRCTYDNVGVVLQTVTKIAAAA